MVNDDRKRHKAQRARENAWREVEKLVELACCLAEADGVVGSAVESVIFEYCAANKLVFRKVHRALIMAAAAEILHRHVEKDALEEQWGDE